MAGLAFKMSAVPFHMWTPDVYEGAPTPVTTFFASAAKMAAVAVTLRVVVTAFPGIVPQWQQIIVFLSILSMVLGGFAAIGQTNIKRLMAYSSIGHMGFALVGLAAGTEAGVARRPRLYGDLSRDDARHLRRDPLDAASTARMSRRSPISRGSRRTDGVTAFFLAMMMFSLAGIPPLAGFFAKWYVFNAAIQAHLYPLAVIGVLASAVAAYYYLRIVKIMYFDEPAPAFDKPTPSRLRVGACGDRRSRAVVVRLSGPLHHASTAAAKSLF